jgi:predicted translin family RNA/ssDNA-binding protein
MAGTKRKHEGDMAAANEASSEDQKSPFISVFETFRAELDEHHDRRERITKVSRDVTAQSKKMSVAPRLCLPLSRLTANTASLLYKGRVLFPPLGRIMAAHFMMHRTRELGRPIHASISKTTAPMYAAIRDFLQSIAPDLQGINNYRYQDRITGGIQEYMEAVTFQHYLEHQQIMSFEDAAAQLPEGITPTYEDYALGLFDMTGELMRFAITYMATNGKLPSKLGQEDTSKSSILADLQDLRAAFEGINPGKMYPLAKEFESKLKTTRQSVEKVENGVYQMIVRGKERPKGWRPETSLPDTRGEGEAIESF